MSVTAAQVKELRDKTGAGIMDSKRALEESEGDIAKAESIPVFTFSNDIALIEKNI